MSKELDEIELRLKMLVAEERRRVRARHSRLATIELNTSVPRIERDFYAAVQSGKLPDFMDFFPVDGGE